MRVFILLLVMAFCLSLSGCNTLSGVGRDLQGLGGALEDWGGK